MAQNGKNRAMSPRARAWAVLIVCAAVLGVTALAAGLWVDERPAAAVTSDVLVDSDRGVKIHTTVCVPDRGRRWPLVVLCHGFLGDRTVNGHAAALAEMLAEAGIASIRPDFSGCGQSEEGFDQYTLAHMTADVDACIAYMAANYPIDTDTVGLVGHSMGGRLVSLYLGGAGRYDVDAAALWSPANGDGLRGAEFLDIEDFAHVEQAAADAMANGAAVGWGVPISGAYFDGMANSHPNEALTNADIPLLLCYTGNEGIISGQTQQETIAAVQAHPGNQVVLDPWKEASHNYIAFDRDRAAELDPQLAAELVQMTEAFLKEHLE